MIQTTFTIANGQTVSDRQAVENIRNAALLHMPAAMVGTNLTMQTPDPAGVLRDVYDDEGNVVVLTFAANRPVVFSKFMPALAAVSEIAWKSDATESGGAITIVLESR